MSHRPAPALATPADIDKLTRIRQLRAHGLNTPRVELIEARTAVDESLRLRLVEIAAGDERMTVRTYRSDDEIGHAKGPFIPEVPVGEAIAAVEELVSGWDILFQEAIDVEETVLAGNLVLSGSGWGRYEVLRGTYRVRDVDDLPGGASKDLAAARFDSLDEIHDPLVRDAAERVVRSGLLYAVSPGMDEPVVLELNVQSAPVGALKEPLLWWEWRPLVPHKQSAHIPAVRATANPTERIWSLGVESLPEPDATDLLALGGKGAGLACARSRGLPTPPAFVLSPPVDPAEIGELQLGAAVEALLEEGQSRLGRSPDTARLAVRSSPVDSMPGMLDTGARRRADDPCRVGGRWHGARVLVLGASSPLPSHAPAWRVRSTCGGGPADDLRRCGCRVRQWGRVHARSEDRCAECRD